MLILAADTSTPYLSIALCRDTAVVAEISILADRKHSEKLLLYVDQLLRETETALSDIDLLAIAHGPGSFTGIRVGVSAWKGLAAGADLPIVGISTLDALARRAEASERTLCTLLDAKMNEVYGAVYRYERTERRVLLDHTVAPVEAILEHCSEDTLFLGDGATLYSEQIRTVFPDAQMLHNAYGYPGASAVAFEALTLIESGVRSANTNVTPVYLRKSQAEVNRDEQQNPLSTL